MTRTMTGGDADLAAVGALLAEPARVAILQALLDGRSLPAGRLASEAGIAASTASAHLSRLLDGGLVAVEEHGRHRYYRLAGSRVAAVLEQLAVLAPSAPVRSLRDDTKARALRRARTCYDHFAGEFGVAIMDALLGHGLLAGHDGTFRPGIDHLSARGPDACYHLTGRGHDVLAGAGIPLDEESRRPFIRYCVDWTEQRHHLAGRLGALLATHMWDQAWVKRSEVHRAVRVTPKGADELKALFDVDASPFR